MQQAREEHRTGLVAVETLTTLVQRSHHAEPGKGLYQAGELQFWWGVPRSTDDLPQLFWFDDDDQPVAAVTITDFGDGSSLVYDEPTMVLSVMPDATPEWIAHVIDRGLAHIAECGIDAVDLEVDQVDEVTRGILFDRGFTVKGAAVVECRLEAAARPEVSLLADGYRLAARSETSQLPHHMTSPRRVDYEARIQQMSLYRPDLDLVVLDADDNPAAYGLFWFDQVTSTGVVEPMRTHDEHQQRGLARHILTSGVELLVIAGATQVSIGYEPDNPSSGHLYRSAGFEPHTSTDVMGGPTAPTAS